MPASRQQEERPPQAAWRRRHWPKDQGPRTKTGLRTMAGRARKPHSAFYCYLSSVLDAASDDVDEG